MQKLGNSERIERMQRNTQIRNRSSLGKRLNTDKQSHFLKGITVSGKLESTERGKTNNRSFPVQVR